VLVDEHARDPELYEVLATVPGGDSGARSLSAGLRTALGPAIGDGKVFVIANMIDSLCHAAALRRPRGMSVAAAKAETVRAIVGYANAA
jgi:hypothetical protein